MTRPDLDRRLHLAKICLAGLESQEADTAEKIKAKKAEIADLERQQVEWENELRADAEMERAA